MPWSHSKKVGAVIATPLLGGTLAIALFSIRHHRQMAVTWLVTASLRPTIEAFNHCGPRILVTMIHGSNPRHRRIRYFVNPNYPNSNNPNPVYPNPTPTPAQRWIWETTAFRLSQNRNALPIQLNHVNTFTAPPFLSVSVNVLYPQVPWGMAGVRITDNFTETPYRTTGPTTLSLCYAQSIR